MSPGEFAALLPGDVIHLPRHRGQGSLCTILEVSFVQLTPVRRLACLFMDGSPGVSIYGNKCHQLHRAADCPIVHPVSGRPALYGDMPGDAPGGDEKDYWDRWREREEALRRG